MSVDRRMRTDMRAIGQEVTPDTWTALEEVKQMADKQRTRRNVVLAVAAAVVVLVGIAVVPAVGDWWQTTSDPAPAGQEGEDAQRADANPAAEALLDELVAAINASDVQGVLDLLTDDAVFFGTPVDETETTGLGREIDRIARQGPLERVEVPALVATDGFDHAIVFLGSYADDGNEYMFLVRARPEGSLKVYEIETLKGR